MPSNDVLSFRAREFKGSRLRCLLATHRSRGDVAQFLSALAGPVASVMDTEHWFPDGFLKPDEPKLGETVGLLDEPQRKLVTDWWLAKPGRANTPNWDLGCKTIIDGRHGLMLVEAKAHEKELKTTDDVSDAVADNALSIASALLEATTAWNGILPGFSLTANSHYQLSNRFAFAWKLAAMKIPVVLVYLGFLDADEMSGHVLRDHAQWRQCVVDRSKGVIPTEAWDRTFDIDGTPLTVLIRSAKVRVEATVGMVEGEA